MLVDKFNRTVDLIHIEASGACQYSCSHCRQAGTTPVGGLLPTEHLLRFIRTMSLLGLKRARLIGGEPLMRPDIVDLVSGLTSIPKLSVSLATNGERLVELAGKLSAAKLDRIFVTLPTLQDNTFKQITGKAGLSSIQEGITAVKGVNGTAVTVKMTVLPGVNDHEIEDVVEWSLSRNLDIYIVEGVFDPLNPLSADDIVGRLGGQYKLTRMKGVAINNNPWKVEGKDSIVKIVTSQCRRYCETCNRMWLSATGRLSLCSKFSPSYDLANYFEDDPTDNDLAQFAAMLALNRPRGAGECLSYSKQARV